MRHDVFQDEVSRITAESVRSVYKSSELQKQIFLIKYPFKTRKTYISWNIILLFWRCFINFHVPFELFFEKRVQKFKWNQPMARLGVDPYKEIILNRPIAARQRLGGRSTIKAPLQRKIFIAIWTSKHYIAPSLSYQLSQFSADFSFLAAKTQSKW